MESDKNINTKKLTKKDIKFVNERIDILQKIYDILGITESNKTFFICHLNDDKKNKIDELIGDIKKYFNTSNYPSLRSNSTTDKNKHIAIIRSIFKDLNINFTRSSCVMKNDDNINISTSMYFIHT